MSLWLGLVLVGVMIVAIIAVFWKTNDIPPSGNDPDRGPDVGGGGGN